MNLTGKLLIAMPGMGDPRFDRSVILLCGHATEEGAMGLIINQRAKELNFKQLLEQINIKPAKPLTRNSPIHVGGPVDHGRGFVLHSPEYEGNESTLPVDDQFGMTATLDILEDIALGQGPKKVLLALGYSGWGPGQLESEILSNGWLTADATPELVFDEPVESKWERALATLGVDPLTLSASAGHA
jgi:putative transcriptional regulator